MYTRNSELENQYHRHGLFEAILQQLREQDIDVDKVARADISGVDEFHVRGAEVSREIIQGLQLRSRKVLDVGCGLGGPARMLADECNCQVWGIDMSREFIRTARKLSDLAGLGSKTHFIRGDALALPFDEASFDVAWSQHVQMNIEDKHQFYSEISRVLRPGGVFIYYDIFKANGGEITFPVPWADNSAISFLQTSKNMDAILGQLGFVKEKTTDQTDPGIRFLKRTLSATGAGRMPKVSLNLLMGGSTPTKLGNLLDALEKGILLLQSGCFAKTTFRDL